MSRWRPTSRRNYDWAIILVGCQGVFRWSKTNSILKWTCVEMMDIRIMLKRDVKFDIVVTTLTWRRKEDTEASKEALQGIEYSFIFLWLFDPNPIGSPIRYKINLKNACFLKIRTCLGDWGRRRRRSLLSRLGNGSCWLRRFGYRLCLKVSQDIPEKTRFNRLNRHQYTTK